MFLPSTSILATSSSGAFGLGIAVVLILMLVVIGIYVFFAYCLAKIFEKAGRPGWPAYVPIYNGWVYYELGGKPGWLVLLGLLTGIPIIGIIAGIAVFVIDIIVGLEVAKRFERSAAFGILLLVFLPFIGLPILAFGKSQYRGPAAAGAGPSPATPPQPNVGMPPSGPAITPEAPGSAPSVTSPDNPTAPPEPTPPQETPPSPPPAQ